ncbi:adenylosuccinate synthetase [Pseudomonas typographi]|uniref:adenylosuccinate synthetase n=1 Tax=Pseudomonas typographi TaxID=2715964 RepID=UPI0016853DDD|nr:adenylosuccinate synthetase [Pseudomonas typographi]MBD1554091.1 adenylosuccinate synthetase [Pseudomonas typographi]
MNKPSAGFADVLVGLQYGDEGKAKIVDLLAHDYDIIARFNGGANAGHTVITPHGEAKLKQIPSAVFHANKVLYIGSGCVVNMVKLAAEIKTLADLGISLKQRLFISHRCSVVQPHHIALDLEYGSVIGTTGKGIGPCYADHSIRMKGHDRSGIQLKDLCSDPSTAFTIVQKNLSKEIQPPLSASQISSALAEIEAAWELVAEYVVEDDLFLTKRVSSGERVLFEGAQSVLLDTTFGEQPYVTSSRTGPSYAYTGGDLSCRFHRKSIGIVKAIMSRVGAGSFPSEFGGSASAEYCNTAASRWIGREEESRLDYLALLRSASPLDIGKGIRIQAGEYGTGSGRPRRIGALDLVNLKATVAFHGIDEVFINRCDSLSLFKLTRNGRIPTVVEYGKSHPDVKVKTMEFEGFDLAELDTAQGKAIPPQLEQLIDFIERYVDCDVVGVGVGPKRSDNISRTAKGRK